MSTKNRTILYFAPDGFSSRMPRMSAGLKSAVAAAIAGKMAEGDVAEENARFNNHDGYDDGLVHEHFWAFTEEE